jgi:hypothetical protein
VLFVGDDWAEAHHDLEIEDETGRVLARRRLPEGLAGITTLHELVAEHLDPAAEPDQVLVGIETERGPWVQALLAGGYVVFAINPLQVARYRERHSPSGAKFGCGGCASAGRDRPVGSGASPRRECQVRCVSGIVDLGFFG